MSEIGRMVEQLTAVHEGEAWHGPSVREALDGVTAKGAAARPVGAAHSVWEIVHHIRVTDEVVCARLAGGTAPTEDDWPRLGDTSEAAWQNAVAGLRSAQHDHDLYHAGQISLLKKGL